MESHTQIYKDGLSYQSELTVVDRTMFRCGGAYRKNLVNGTIGSREVSLVERGSSLESKFYYRKWKALKAAGLPVVPSMRLTSVGSVVMTNIRADGSELYGKGLIVIANSEPDDFGYEVRRSHPLDQRYLELVNSDRHIGSIIAAARSIANVANQSSIQLAVDDPFELVIRPNGRWEVLCLDLQTVRLGQVAPEELNEFCVNQLFRQLNDNSVKRYLEACN